MLAGCPALNSRAHRAQNVSKLAAFNVTVIKNGLDPRCVQSITLPGANARRLEGSMNAVNGTMLCLAVAMGALACSAQDAMIPIRQLEQDGQLSAKLATPGGESAVSHSNGVPSGSSSAAGFVLAPPAYKATRTLSRGFFLMNGLHLGMADRKSVV